MVFIWLIFSVYFYVKIVIFVNGMKKLMFIYVIFVKKVIMLKMVCVKSVVVYVKIVCVKELLFSVWKVV